MNWLRAGLDTDCGLAPVSVRCLRFSGIHTSKGAGLAHLTASAIPASALFRTVVFPIRSISSASISAAATKDDLA